MAGPCRRAWSRPVQGGELRAIALVTLGEDIRPADAGPRRQTSVPDVASIDESVDWEELRLEAAPTGGERRPSPVQVRVAPEGSCDDGTSRSHAWIRLRRPLPADPAVHVGALAFATDLTLLRSVVRPERSPWDVGRALTLNHTVWFHGAARWDGWILYATSCATASAGRALAAGTLFAGDEPIATTHQDGLVLW